MARRQFSNTSKDTTISGAINAVVTSLTVADASGYPSSGAFAVVLDEGQATEEVVLVGSRSSTAFNNLTRGYDGTTASTHASGAAIRHVIIALDMEDLHKHVWDTPGVAADTNTATGVHHTRGTAIATQAVGDAATAGSSNKFAPEDHKHAMPSFGGNGAATSIARSDHSHSTGTASCARVTKSAAQSITSGVDTVITFDQEDFDTDAYHSTISNTSRFTVPSGLGGKFLINAVIHLETPAVPSGFFSFVRLNGVTNKAKVLAWATGTGGGNQGWLVSCILPLAAGDYVEVLVRHTSGVDKAVQATETFFEIARLGS